MPSDSPTPAVDGLDAAKLIAGALSPVSSPAFAWEPPTVAQVAPWFPDYEVQALAGRGSMGAVYRAVQRKLERPVAIKLLPPALAARDGAIARFEREARAMAQLNHPHIVALHDYGRTAEGHLYIVMEYMDGADLSRLIHQEGGGLSVPQALEIVTQVCDALQYAHSRGFVHRDIKPGNVLVDKDGRVKIADFGLAKLLGDTPRDTAATMTGTILGTPDYTAPEQLKGGTVDHRADIYSLGVMFYEMLTGDLPRGAWEPPSKRTAGASVGLDEVVTRAMQSEPDKRYQQASEVKIAVEGTRIPAPATPAGQNKGAPFLTNRILFWLMAICFMWMAFVTPTGDMLTYLMLAGPCLLLAFFFFLRRKPSGVVSAFLAGMAVCFAILMTVLSVREDEKAAETRTVRQIQNLGSELKELRTRFSDDHPQVEALLDRIDAAAYRSRDAQRAAAQARAGVVSAATESDSRLEPVQAARDGRILVVKVIKGQHVVAGSVVAELDSSRIKQELKNWRLGVLERWASETRDIDKQLLPLEAEIRQLQTADAEDSAIIKELQTMVEENDKLRPGEDPKLREMRQNNPDIQLSRVELTKARGRNALNAQNNSAISEQIQRLKVNRDTLANFSKELGAVDILSENDIPKQALKSDELQSYQELIAALANSSVMTIRGGIVERVGKEVGEFVKTGEAVVFMSQGKDVIVTCPEMVPKPQPASNPVNVPGSSR